MTAQPSAETIPTPITPEILNIKASLKSLHIHKCQPRVFLTNIQNAMLTIYRKSGGLVRPDHKAETSKLVTARYNA